jgi:hypothetical protein
MNDAAIQSGRCPDPHCPALFRHARIGATPAATAKPYQEEWVYRVKYGSQDEWWHLFQTYQIAALDEEKRRGYVLDYTVVRPGLRTPGIKGATDRPVAPD